MKGILAVKDGSGVFLSRNEQVHEFLEKGFSLYIYEDRKKELLASPVIGFVREIPTISIDINKKGHLNNGERNK